MHKAKLLQNVMCAFPEPLQQVCLYLLPTVVLAVRHLLSSQSKQPSAASYADAQTSKLHGQQAQANKTISSISIAELLQHDLKGSEHDAERVKGCQGLAANLPLHGQQAHANGTIISIV